MALDFCHTALLHFVHIVLWVRLYLWTLVSRFISKHIGLCIGEQRKLSAERCRIDSKNLPKLPLHIGLQILENRISDEDVANLLVWCIAMGFQYVSLFDDEGYFKKNPSKLRDVMQKKMAAILESNRLVFHIETPVRNGERSVKVTTTTKETLQDTKSTRIALMSCEDGRGDILESARRLCQDVADKRYRASEIGITNLDQVMNSLLDYPDPDLIIQFGQVNSLLGYSPWKIRVTEILSVPTHHGMNYQSFIDVLHSYSKTQQRYGK
ncbi:dehydrodolichyl diphosphate synthase complex subunit nus1-like [Lytechinus variegatus]|uniref:dehydrodolichyl diphosphate synthase complex subunit nus1-like n=1 Tax=Lytechinus variegatus TaxID=7654 RepID=UPI001BB225EA|nr:dehydrodolichyl diphosphate synthase complex subunit nus1-like [Lytechinus variegatus]